MGICTSGNKQLKNTRKCHCILYEQKNDSAFLDLRTGTHDYEINDFLLTTSGYLVLGNNPDSKDRKIYWTKKFKRNSLTTNMVIFKLELTRCGGFYKGNFVENLSFGNAEHQRFWEVLNSVGDDEEEHASRGIVLNDKDIIKFGRQVARVSICLAKQSLRNEGAFDDSHGEHSFYQEKKTDSIKNHTDEYSARTHNGKGEELNSNFESTDICWSCDKTQTIDNPFHDFCACSQSNPRHLSCLRQWLESRIKRCLVSHLQFFDFTGVACEYCEQPFHAFGFVNNVRTPIIDPHLVRDCSYAILEIYNADDHKILSGMVVISMAEDQEITLGRNKKSDIVFKDESVSQRHGIIQIFKEQLFLIDLRSRHGTFRLVKNPLKFNEPSNRLYSIGKWLVEFHAFRGSVCGCEEEVTCIPISHKNPYQDYTNLLMSDTYAKSETYHSNNGYAKISSNIAQLSVLSEGRRQVRFEKPTEHKFPTESYSQTQSISAGKENYHDREGKRRSDLPMRMPTDLFDVKSDHRLKPVTRTSLQQIPSESHPHNNQKGNYSKYEDISQNEEDDFTDSYSQSVAQRQRRSTLFKSILKANEYRQSLFTVQPHLNENDGEEEGENGHQKKELKRFMTDFFDEIVF